METMLLFGLIGAIAFVLFKENFSTPNAAEPAPAPAAPMPEVQPEPEVKPKTAKKKAPAKAKAKPAPKKPSPITAKSGYQLKDPDTGEIATVPGSYRFIKRWIKEALVTEGLLPKVYKNTEIDDTINEQIQTAIAAFKTIKKYQV